MKLNKLALAIAKAQQEMAKWPKAWREDAKVDEKGKPKR